MTSRMPIYRDRSTEIFWSCDPTDLDAVDTARRAILSRVCPSFLPACKTTPDGIAMTMAVARNGAIRAGVTAQAVDFPGSSLPRLDLTQLFVDTNGLTSRDLARFWKAVVVLGHRIGVSGIDMLVPENAERPAKVMFQRMGEQFKATRQDGFLKIECALH